MSKEKLQKPESSLPVDREKGASVGDLHALTGNRDLLAQMGTPRTMPEGVRAKMESAMGADFSGVELYESPLVGQRGARAAASGRAIAFNAGEMNFSSSAGLELLGHELSHVASQARGEARGSGFLNDPALERKADAEGFKAAHSAFESATGATLVPMSEGLNGLPLSAPVQAWKDGAHIELGLKDAKEEDRERGTHVYVEELTKMQKYRQMNNMRTKEDKVFDEAFANHELEEEDMEALLEQYLLQVNKVMERYRADCLRLGFDRSIDLKRVTQLTARTVEAIDLTSMNSLLRTVFTEGEKQPPVPDGQPPRGARLLEKFRQVAAARLTDEDRRNIRRANEITSKNTLVGNIEGLEAVANGEEDYLTKLGDYTNGIFRKAVNRKPEASSPAGVRPGSATTPGDVLVEAAALRYSRAEEDDLEDDLEDIKETSYAPELSAVEEEPFEDAELEPAWRSNEDGLFDTMRGKNGESFLRPQAGVSAAEQEAFWRKEAENEASVRAYREALAQEKLTREQTGTKPERGTETYYPEMFFEKREKKRSNARIYSDGIKMSTSLEEDDDEQLAAWEEEMNEAIQARNKESNRLHTRQRKGGYFRLLGAWLKNLFK